VYLGGIAAGMKYGSRDGWRGFSLILSLFCYSLFTRLASAGGWSVAGFLILTGVFAGSWFAVLVAPRFVRTVIDFMATSKLAWVRACRKVFWIVFGFLLLLLIVASHPTGANSFPLPSRFIALAWGSSSGLRHSAGRHPDEAPEVHLVPGLASDNPKGLLPAGWASKTM